MRLADLSSSGPVVVVDAGVVRDMAAALNGLWTPDAEPNPDRAAELVAAARLRLYGNRDRSGWLLVSTRAGADSAGKRGDADWTVGLLPVAEEFEDAPTEADIDGLAQLYRKEAVLFEPVDLVVARIPRAFRHTREHDLPARLELLDPREAVDRLEIGRGEPPLVSLPAGSMLADLDPWWIPSESDPA
jgi:hypothetical protein